MTQKTSLTLAAALGLAGIGIYFATQPSLVSANDTPGASASRRAPGQSSDRPDSEGEVRSKRRDSVARQATDAWPELAEKYGKTRTHSCSRFVTKMTGQLDELATLRESAESIAKYRESAGRSIEMLSGSVNLTAEQKATAAKLIDENLSRQRAGLKNYAAALRDDPRPIAELLLAADACAGQEISKEDYEAQATRTREALQAAGASPSIRTLENPLGPFYEPDVQAGLEQVLDPDQIAAFREAVGPQSQTGLGEIDLTKIPPRKLEVVEQVLFFLVPEE